MQSLTNTKRLGGLAWNAKSAWDWTMPGSGRSKKTVGFGVAIHCPGATGIGLTLGSFDVPEGAALFIWNQDRTQFLGSFTEANEKDWGFLPIGLLDDDQIVVEYQEPLAVHGQGDVSISQIVHGYRSLLLHPQSPAANEANMGPFGNSGACNINVNCPEGAEWQTPKKSVALITNGGFAVCSGALVNNTSEDGTPYFLTANRASETQQLGLLFQPRKQHLRS